MNLRLITCVLITSGLACGSREKDSEICSTFRTESTRQIAEMENQISTLRKRVKAAIDTPPTPGDSPCGVGDLNPRHYWLVSSRTVEREAVPGVLGAFPSHASLAERCGYLPPDQQQSGLDAFRESVASLPGEHMLLFVEGTRKKPKLIDAKTYEPGHLTGRVHLWSYGEQRIVCTAEAEAQSSKQLITDSGRLDDTLDDHLTDVTVAAGAKQLRRIEP